MTDTSVTVIIPTFRRVGGMRRAAKSVMLQENCRPFELLIVDNDPDASAREAAEALAQAANENVTVRYLHEPRAGVANARNAAIAATTSRLIAFLDDDQSAPSDWLCSLLECHRQFPAAVTFGPVRATLPPDIQQHTEYLKHFFSRPYEGPTGYIEESYGCGNSLIALDLIPPQRPMFDTAMNETGGEDDLLFGRVRRAKGRFAWCAEAPVAEHVPANRATLHYTLRRAMAYGQGPVTLARKQERPNWLLVAFWMLVGIYKLVVNGAIYAMKFAMRASDRAEYLDRAARGFGKIVWWRKLRFYGATRLQTAPDTAVEN